MFPFQKGKDAKLPTFPGICSFKESNEVCRFSGNQIVDFRRNISGEIGNWVLFVERRRRIEYLFFIYWIFQHPFYMIQRVIRRRNRGTDIATMKLLWPRHCLTYWTLPLTERGGRFIWASFLY